MDKRVVLAILIITLLWTPAHARKKPGRELIITGETARPPQAQVAGKLKIADEYQVYSSLIRKIVGDDKRRSLVVMRLSIDKEYPHGLDHSLRYQFRKNMDERTFRDFASKTSKNYELLTQYFDAGIEIVLVTKLDYLAPRDAACEVVWREFYRAYPKAKGVMEFSRVGFNSEKTQAFVYANYWSGCTKGKGRYFFLQRDGDGWKVVKALTEWRISA